MILLMILTPCELLSRLLSGALSVAAGEAVV